MGILRLPLRNELSELKRINFTLGEFLEEEGVPPGGINRVRLVIEELFVNIVRHAYDDGAAHDIVLDVRTGPGSATVVLEDDGKPFNPVDAPTPTWDGPLESRSEHGHGIVIVKHLAREFSYARADGRNRVRAVVEYHRPKEST